MSKRNVIILLVLLAAVAIASIVVAKDPRLHPTDCGEQPEPEPAP